MSTRRQFKRNSPADGYRQRALSFHAYSRDWKALEGYCKSFDDRDCTIDYEDYQEAYQDYADECREKSIELKNAQAKKNH